MKQKTIIGVSFILWVILTILVITGNAIEIDEAIYHALMKIRCNQIDAIMKCFSFLGNTIPVLCVVCFCMIFLQKKERYLFGSNIIITVLSNQLIKHIIRRPRPDHLRLVQQGGFSYPSGHAMIAIGLYGLLIYFVNKKIHNKTKRIIYTTLLIIIIIGICISRIYVGVHYPSDVIAGCLLSTSILLEEIGYWKRYRGSLK